MKHEEILMSQENEFLKCVKEFKKKTLSTGHIKQQSTLNDFTKSGLTIKSGLQHDLIDAHINSLAKTTDQIELLKTSFLEFLSITAQFVDK